MTTKKKNKVLDVSQVRTDEGHSRAEFEIVSTNDDDRTIELVFTTGQGGTRYDWNSGSYYIEELDVTPESIREARLKKGLSVIDSHQPYSIDNVFGITEAYTIENGELRGTVRFANDPQSDIIYQKVKDRILKHVSIGYKVHEYTTIKSATAENLQVLRATDWTPTELSFVAVSFEDNNGVRTLDSEELKKRGSTATNLAKIKGNEDMLTEAEKKAKAKADADALAVEQARIKADATPAKQTAAPAPAAPASRQDDLAVMLRAVDNAGLNVDFATDHFSRGTNVADFNQAVIAELGRASKAETVEPVLKADNRQDHQASVRQAVEDSIAIRANQKVADTSLSRDYQGLTLFETARDFLRANGENVNGMSRQKVASRAFHSTSDFPLLLANVMNKSLQGGYQEVEQTFKDLGYKTTVNDFREKHTVRLGDAPDLLPLGENGEYKSGTFTESGEKYAISTFARKIGFTRQMLINDDLSGLTKVPQMYGRAGSRLESDIVWGLLLGYDFINNKAKATKLLDGKNLFDASRGNYLTGATSAVSQDALSNLRKLGRKMKTQDGKFMNVSYNKVVVSEDQETAMEKILMGTILATQTGDTNIFTNKLQMRVEPRLSVVDGTGDAWLAFANLMDTFEFASLSGEEDMYTELVESTDSDGLTLKVRKDFGAGIVDYRGMAMATGK